MTDRTVHRRQFLARSGVLGAAAALGPGFWQSALAAPAQPGESPYGPLQPPDANGLMLPAGFTSRVVASSLLPVADTGHVWHIFPDGGACVPTDDGGWIYVSNSEFPVPVDLPVVSGLMPALKLALGTLGLPIPTAGGVGAIRFSSDGAVVDAYPVLTTGISNCAGGLTPWGTWLSCEEWEDAQALPSFTAGRVWECDPFGVTPPVVRTALGLFKHEMAAADTDRHHLYLSEDQTDGLLYRYTPPAGTWGSGAALEGGLLEAMVVAADDTVSWVRVADFTDPAAPSGPIRELVAGAKKFNGGEGVIYDSSCVYLTTKGDDRVWVYDIEANTMTVLYDAAEHISPVLNGVDNIAVTAAHDLYVAEDGGNLEVCVITPDRVVAPVVRMTGGQHGFDTGTPIPLISEVTGLAFSPDGNRLYFNSERGLGLANLPVGPGPGILYEVTGPWRGGTLAAAQQEPPPTTTTAPPPPTAPPTSRPAASGAELPATGGDTDVLVPAAVATAAAAALWRLRERARPDAPPEGGR